MATKSRSKHQENLYKIYQAQNRQASNRKRKLEKLLKENPDNLEIKAALNNIGYRRRTPKNNVWSHSSKAAAKLAKLFVSVLDKTQPRISEKEMFKLSARANGGLIWNF